MRELAVYYCPGCGHYAFYQLPKHAVCPKCSTAMRLLRMHYTDFMKLNCQERDELLAMEILKLNPSVIARIIEPHKMHNTRQIIAEMCHTIRSLETENKVLSDTVNWMHDAIWDMVKSERVKEPLTLNNRGETTDT